MSAALAGTSPAGPAKGAGAAEEGAEAASPAWDAGTLPRVTAAVSTYRRASYLAGLVAALEAQTLPLDQFEVVVVDNGSGDGTWDRLVELAAATPLRMRVSRLASNRGPAGGRNQAVSLARGAYVAFTDDDCLPTPGWLEAVVRSFTVGVDLVQGRVQAEAATQPTLGPWGHTIWVTGPTPFYEACNVAYRRAAFEAAGGFDEDDPLTAQLGGRAFGEDACLAWRVRQAGGASVFVGDAVVEHRCLPGRFRDRLSDHRYLKGFPGLANRSPLVARSCWHRVFLTRQSAAFDLAVVSLVAAVAWHRPLALVGIWPWLRRRWPEARATAGGSRATACWRLAQLATVDLVSLASLAEGSVRHRRLML